MVAFGLYNLEPDRGGEIVVIATIPLVGEGDLVGDSNSSGSIVSALRFMPSLFSILSIF